jgi:primary-amine oxidase
VSGETEGESNKRKLQNEGGGDGTGHMVSWMGWTFHASVDPMHGLVIRDLTFKGERIIYELSFQEYFASYSAMGSHSEVFYFDSAFRIGNLSPLELGKDCPDGALLLPMSQHSAGQGSTRQDVMCIFEQPYGEAMWRHYYSGNIGANRCPQVGGIPRTSLQVRIVSTMGNYDYIPTVKLMADGVMETKLEMGGFLQGGYGPFDSPNEESPKFGSQVREHLVGLLHDHMIGLRVDFDVGGTSNKFVTGKVQYGTHQEVMGKPKPGWHSYDGIKYMNFTTLEKETGVMAKDYDSLIVESNTLNSWGEKKSYEIVFDHTVSTQVFPRDHPLAAGTEWQYSNVAITTHKDDERFCSFPSNHLFGTAIPSFDLKTFKNDESIVDEDLVMWIMFGVQHYPKAEDIPLVSNFGSGFVIKPRNFFDRAAFEDLADNRNVQSPSCAAPSIA